MNNYRVEGESRKVGATGMFEKFIENVVAESSLEAYGQVRESQYANNREYVLIKRIDLLTVSENITGGDTRLRNK